MASPVLVGIDPRDLERAPLEFGARMHLATGAPLLLASVYVYQGGLSPVPAWEPPAEDATRILRAVANALADRGIDADICSVGRPNAADGLHDLAERASAAVVVVGSTHRGRIGTAIPGTTAARLAHCGIAIAVVPADYQDAPLRRIGVAFAPTEEGRNALGGAALLAHALDADLHVVSVHQPIAPLVPSPLTMPPAMSPDGGVSADELADAVRRVPYGVRVTSELLDGDTVAHLIAISHDVDLLVCGSRGRAPLADAVRGSVTSELSRRTACPLVIEPRGTMSGLASLVGAAALAEPSS